MSDPRLIMKIAAVLAAVIWIGTCVAVVMTMMLGPWLMWPVLALTITGGVVGWMYSEVQRKERPGVPVTDVERALDEMHRRDAERGAE